MDSLITLFADPAVWAALVTLVVMEVVLGIDNLIFISILSNKLPEEQRQRARRIGIGLALGMRLARYGYRIGVIDSTTWEEAPVGFTQWLRQRTRWFKGWAQTWTQRANARQTGARERTKGSGSTSGQPAAVLAI